MRSRCMPIMSDPFAMRYWSTPPHAALSDTEQWMASMVGADAQGSDDFIVTLAGDLIGKLGAWKLPEVGFLIAPAHWGRAMRARRWALSSNGDEASGQPS